MTREFSSAAELERALEDHFANGGCFVSGAFDGAEGDLCEVELVAPSGERMSLDGIVVWVGSGDNPGVGVQFVGFDRALLDRLAGFVRAAEDHADARAADADLANGTPVPATRTSARSPHERMRGLTMAQQMKVAREGDVNERIILERIYGKSVWDALLSNPRLTHPEVARIARMGQLPRPQLEQIVANGHWIASPQVRRALLANRRLTRVMVDKILRATPKHELTLMPKQTAYPSSVREAARKLLKRQ